MDAVTESTRINRNLECFSIENHQGVAGPDRVDPVPVIESDFRNVNYTNDLATFRCDIVLAAWLARGDHDGLSQSWLGGASAYGELED